MKYLVVSDLHGATAVVEHFEELMEKYNCSMILCLGDVLYHGPRNDLPESYAPKRVIELLKPLTDKIICVRGNCDAYVDQMVLPFALTADYNTLMLGTRRVFMTHGHLYDPSNHPQLPAGSVFLYGHTHLPVAMKEKDLFVLNPGSVSIPKGGNPASFGVLDDEEFVIYTLDGTILNQIKFA